MIGMISQPYLPPLRRGQVDVDSQHHKANEFANDGVSISVSIHK